MDNEPHDLASYYQDLRVGIRREEAFYSTLPPFDPGDTYPEYILGDATSKQVNPAYRAVRNVFQILGLDKENFGSSDWNPLGEVITPGNKVVIKPNFVLSRHEEGGNLFSIITHPSVLRAVVDYTYKALDGRGRIVIADAPQMDCDFQELLETTNLQSVQELYQEKLGFEIKILDLRDFWLAKNLACRQAPAGKRIKLPGDPSGSVTVNVGARSEFCGVKNWTRFYGADYNRDETIRHHNGQTQEYMISRTVLSADVLICVPKLKVHKKVGVTLNAKGLVGTNTNKNYLVHYTLGTPDEGGDQFPPGVLSRKERSLIKTQRFLYDALLSRSKPFSDRIYVALGSLYRRLLKPLTGHVSPENTLLDAGNWHGNDSAWRMVSDLMKIILYADKNGRLQSEPQRKVFSIIDGIVGGQNNGPLTPDQKQAGVVIAGFNPLAVDIAAARLMGFNWEKLKWAQNLLHNEHFEFFLHNVNDIRIVTDVCEFQNMFDTNDKLLNFKPHPGWRGFIEIAQNSNV